MRGKTLVWISLIAMLLISPLAINIFASPGTEMYVSLAVSTANPIGPHTVDINIYDVTDLVAYEFKLSYDSSVLQLSVSPPSPEVEKGGFLEAEGPTDLRISYNVAMEYILVGGMLLASGSASDSGTLVKIHFNVIDAGNCTLRLFDTKLYDEYLNPIGHASEDGYFYTTYPKAIFTWSPEHPIIEEDVTFDATASYDPDGGDINEYEWDFGDGYFATGPIVTHQYAAYRNEAYMVTLTVTDEEDDSWYSTKPLRIYRDMAAVDVWITDQNLEVVYFDVYHGMPDPWLVDWGYGEIPVIAIVVTSTNFGSVTEAYTCTLYADLDTGVIGDEIMIDSYEHELGGGKGSGFALWFDWYIGEEDISDCGLYTITAVIETDVDCDPTNNMAQDTVYIHARAEVTKAEPTSRYFKIHQLGRKLRIHGKFKNMEDKESARDGIYARAVVELVTEEGMLLTFKSKATGIMYNGVENGWSVSWDRIRDQDIGTYEATVYCEFGWDGVNFPFRGTEPLTISFAIVP